MVEMLSFGVVTLMLTPPPPPEPSSSSSSSFSAAPPNDPNNDSAVAPVIPMGNEASRLSSRSARNDGSEAGIGLGLLRTGARC